LRALCKELAANWRDATITVILSDVSDTYKVFISCYCEWAAKSFTAVSPVVLPALNVEPPSGYPAHPESLMKGSMVLNAGSTGVRSSSDEATISALAKQTDTAKEVVRHLYDEELAALHAHAKVPNFIGVIAGRRVKQRLRALHRAAPAKRVPSVSASA
jgi:hypothetical protein